MAKKKRKVEHRIRVAKYIFRTTRTGRWGYSIEFEGKRHVRLFDNRTLAEDALATLRHETRLEQIYGKTAPKKIYFRDYAKAYLKRDDELAKKSYSRDKGAVELHLEPFFGDLLLTDMTNERIEKYIAKRKTEKTWQKKPTTGATINREITLLKTMLNRAVESGDLVACPIVWKRIRSQDEQPRDRYLEPEEARALIEAAAKDRSYLRQFMMIAINTGLRKSEILSLTRDKVDFKHGELIVKRRKKRPGTNAYYRMPINQDVIAALKSLPQDSEYFFFNQNTEKPITEVRRAFMTACRKTGIKNLRIHDLRHAFATMLSAGGVDLVSIQNLLGHSSAKMTERYIKPISENLRKAVDSLAGVYQPAATKESTEGRKSDVSAPVEAPQVAHIQ